MSAGLGGSLNRIGWLTLMLIGCLPAPTAEESPAAPVAASVAPAEASPSNAPTLPSAIQPPTGDPLPEFRLAVGNQWEYAYHADWENASADYQLTTGVTAARYESGYFTAEMIQQAKLMAGEPGEGFQRPEEYHYQLIIDQNKVYLVESELEVTNLDSAWLEYVFPLSRDGWCPDPQQRAAQTCNNRRFADGPSVKDTPAGSFKECYLIATQYLSGPTMHWFCLGIGIVAEQYHHNGSKFDYSSALTSYTLRER